MFKRLKISSFSFFIFSSINLVVDNKRKFQTNSKAKCITAYNNCRAFRKVHTLQAPKFSTLYHIHLKGL
jgi:hypothetical protein